MSNKKPYIEDRKALTGQRLLARKGSLEAKGMTEAQINRDPKVKQLKAEIRKAKKQLANIAKNEKQIAKQAEAKAKKLEASTSDQSQKKKSAEAPAKKTAKKKQK